jgi:hypothetical protein
MAAPRRCAILLLIFAACGGAPELGQSCDGLTVEGVCWVARGRISLSTERAVRVMDVAARVWGGSAPNLSGWRIELDLKRTVVDGQEYDGYTWANAHFIVVTPGAPDCFEDSALLHELGHAWGFGHDDPRMSAGWAHVKDAMRNSGWPGCTVPEGEGDD